MQNLKILNKKKVKSILGLIRKQFGCVIELDYVFLINPDNRIFIVNREVFGIDMEKVRMNSLGLYFGELSNGELRLSIEGSQIVGPKAKKGVVVLDNDEIRAWLNGEDLEKDTSEQGFVIITNGKDFFGTGRVKEGKILNYVPKTRRVSVSD